uniref:Medium-chain acyl-CoA ligase ACSF2, mitochondrial n=1 Tax=Amphiprion ocellaris TaxID=80972 RepID=A0AAQ5ZLG0_AMPOC
MIPRVAQSFQSLRNSCALPAAGKPLWRAWTRQGGLPAASRGIHVDCPPIIPTLTSSYVHGTSSTPLQQATVAETLLKSVEFHPDKEAMVFKEDGLRKTFAEFYQDVDRAAAGLLALGLKKGDRLGMWGPNTYEWVLFQFATAKAGIILVSVNPAYQLQEVEFALKKVGVKAIVCPTQFKTQKYCDMLRKICPEIEKASPGDIKSTRLPDLRSVIVLDSRQPGMFHLEDVMQAGSSQYVQQLQDLQKTLQFDDPINIQFTSGTTGTPKGATLTHHNIVNNAYFVGRRMGYHWRVSIGYGTTENSPVTFCGSPMDNMERKSETVGYIMDHVEAKVVNPTTGQIVPLGMTGELMIRGYCVMLEYWADEAKTQECVTKNGWYKTGDIGSLDAYSYCKIEGRIKDMIIRGGENIYPAEIEQFLHTHPKVKEAQVVGVEDPRMGEEICACIRLADGVHCTVEEIRDYCKGQVGTCLPLYFLLSDLSLQDSSLRSVCEQLPAHRHWKGNFLQDDINYRQTVY